MSFFSQCTRCVQIKSFPLQQGASTASIPQRDPPAKTSAPSFHYACVTTDVYDASGHRVARRGDRVIVEHAIDQVNMRVRHCVSVFTIFLVVTTAPVTTKRAVHCVRFAAGAYCRQ